VSLSVPVLFRPPEIRLGLNVTLWGLGVLTTKEADAVPPPPPAVMLAVDFAVTGMEVTEKETLFAPAGTVTETGTLANTWLLDNVTLNPEEPATRLNRTEPTDESPP
jgi:hypothetical protein